MRICLIGSGRFKDLYQETNTRLSKMGHVVYSIAMPSNGAHENLTEREKTVLDLVHLQKIQESEAVILITDHTRYYGESTTRELIWAQMMGKRVFLLPEVAIRFQPAYVDPSELF